jgi:hypothetical protein
MAILTTLTPEQQIAQQIRTGTQSAFFQLVNNYRMLYRTVWNHPTKSPQEVFNILGTDAAQLCDYSNKVINFVNSIVPNTIDINLPQQITVNNDGTVTLTPNA